NGNTLDYTVKGKQRGLSYDGENRLSQETESGSLMASFAYGPDGERIRQVTASGSLTTHYYGGDAELARTQNQIGLGTWTDYVAPDILRANGTLYWLHKDHLGSNRLKTSSAGAVIQRGNFT